MSFKPMLASLADLDQLRFPLLASPKLDGIRCVVRDGKALTRSLKPIPNDAVRLALESPASKLEQVEAALGGKKIAALEGLDGELIVGEPTAHDVYRQTVSGVMRRVGDPKAAFYVFDFVASGQYADRYKRLLERVEALKGASIGVSLLALPQLQINSLNELLAFESAIVDQGYEGLILRDPRAPYKYGRSTEKEGYLLKVKRFSDSECEILGIEEEMHNGNAAQTNELGRTKRSSSKAGLIGKGTMGALKVRDIHHGWVFNIGSGFSAEQRSASWVIGSLHKYKYFPIGMKDAPRHPVYLGPRSELDL